MTQTSNTHPAPIPSPVHVVGGGLAGSEAAWQIARSGVPVVLHEMRPERATDAHKTDFCAELVCSNSFRSDDAGDQRRRRAPPRDAGDGIARSSACADSHQVPAGGALAVDRDGFAAAVTQALEAEPLIEIRREEVAGLPPEDWDNVIVASGPLTSPALAQAIGALTGEAELAFYDAIAPIVHCDSIDMGKAWMQSRYDKVGPGGTGADYVNCPLDREQYEAFVTALVEGPKTEFKDFEKTPYFDGCLPIEVMAERGRETLRHGPMKPVGLTNPHNPTVKALCDRSACGRIMRLGTLYNMVGFQTKLLYGAQVGDLSRDSRAGTRGIRPARRPAPQYLPEFAEGSRRPPAAESASHACVSPARSRDARAMSKARRSA